jgi:hypothetical protein
MSVILSAAKDFHRIEPLHEILRCAQDDDDPMRTPIFWGWGIVAETPGRHNTRSLGLAAEDAAKLTQRREAAKNGQDAQNGTYSSRSARGPDYFPRSAKTTGNTNLR